MGSGKKKGRARARPFFFLLLLCQRDVDEERTAREFLFVVSFALAPDLSLMRLDNARRDRETEAGVRLP